MRLRGHQLEPHVGAPPIVQALGLEWAHRLVQEPQRLFRRYVIEDLPFAVELFGRAALERVTRR